MSKERYSTVVKETPILALASEKHIFRAKQRKQKDNVRPKQKQQIKHQNQDDSIGMAAMNAKFLSCMNMMIEFAEFNLGPNIEQFEAAIVDMPNAEEGTSKANNPLKLDVLNPKNEPSDENFRRRSNIFRKLTRRGKKKRNRKRRKKTWYVSLYKRMSRIWSELTSLRRKLKESFISKVESRSYGCVI